MTSQYLGNLELAPAATVHRTPDSALGCSIHTMLDAGARYTTSDLHVRFVRPMRADTGRVLADCHVVHAGRRLATAEGQLVAESGGTLFAHATTSCLIL